MADLHEAYEDRRAALVAASNTLRFSREDLIARSEETAAAVVAFAELLHSGFFPGSPLLTEETTSS